MKLIQVTYRIDSTDIKDHVIDITVQVDGVNHQFTSAFQFVQYVLGYDETRSWYEFLMTEDLRQRPHYDTVTCGIGWITSPPGMNPYSTHLGSRTYRVQASSYDKDLEDAWQKAWQEAVTHAKVKINNGWLEGVKIVEDDK
jgi:hypothetical protein